MTNDLPRMVVMGTTATNPGYLGLGDYSVFTPQSLFHQHVNSAGVNYHQWTNSTTGSAATDGFKLGITAVGAAQLIQQENNLPIQFLIQDALLGNTQVTRAEFTSGNMMTGGGDGLRFWNPGYTSSMAYSAQSALDIWVGPSNSTHIRWDHSGTVQGQSNHFELIGRLNGFWFNAAPLASQTAVRGKYFFNIDSIEVARIDNPNNAQRGFYRIGINPSNLNPARRLEVFDAANAPQFRITQTAGTAYTDFQSTNTGDLVITPTSGVTQRFVGINTAPSEMLDVNGNARIRNIPSGTGSDAVFVDANGVLYQQPITNFGGGNVIACPTAASGYIPKFTGSTEICNSIASDDGNRFLIGASSILNAKLTLNNSPSGGNMMDMISSNGNYVFNMFDRGPWLAHVDQSFGLSGGYFFEPYLTGLNPGKGMDISVVLNNTSGVTEALRVSMNGTGSASDNRSVSGYSTVPSTGTNIGIWGEASNGAINYAGVFNGDVFVDGDITASGSISDKNFKTNIDTIQNALFMVNQLNPVTFFFDTTNQAGLSLPGKRQFGMTAQDVMKFFPELVNEVTKPAVYDTLGNLVHPAVTFKTLNYNAFIGILVKALQEQKSKTDSDGTAKNSRIDSLEDRLSMLEALVSQCCGNYLG